MSENVITGPGAYTMRNGKKMTIAAVTEGLAFEDPRSRPNTMQDFATVYNAVTGRRNNAPDDSVLSMGDIIGRWTKME